MIKKLGLMGAAILAPVVAFAEGTGGGFAIDSNFADMDMTSIVTDLGSTLFTGITAAIGLAAGCYGAVLLWKKIKGGMRG